MPSMIADQLISVQPMTGPTGNIYVIKNRFSPTPRITLLNDNNKIGLEFFVSNEEFSEMVMYCTETFEGSVLVDGPSWDNSPRLWFKTEADRELFLLRWSE